MAGVSHEGFTWRLLSKCGAFAPNRRKYRMSDKLVRDEILRSHRYQTLSTDTVKLFFIHLMLSSDGHSNAETTTTALSIIMGRTISEETAAALLAELADKDLIRLYQVDGKRYAHIPRARQRIKHPNAKHPRPPKNVEDKQISALIAKVSPRADTVPPQGGRSVVDVLLSNTTSDPAPVDNSGTGKTWAEHWKAKGEALGIKANVGESESAYCRRVMEHVKAT